MKLARVADLVARLVGEDEGLEEVVVGLPRRLDGSPNEQTGRVEAFAAALAARVAVPGRAAATSG